MAKDFVADQRAHCELAPWRVEDAAALDACLANEDFLTDLNSALLLLGVCFLRRPVDEGSRAALDVFYAMDVSSEWPYGTQQEREAAAALIKRGASENPRELDLEFQRLFRGVGQRQAAPFGSVYQDHDGVMYGWTWNALRDWMRACGISTLYEENEPEDQIGRMMLLASQLCVERPELLAEFLGDHLLPWAFRYFELFAADARFDTYRGLGELACATLADVQELMGIVPARRRFFR